VIRSVTFPLGRFRVEDDSMRPTLKPGDYVVVNRWAYHFRRPSAGDVVVVRDPEAPGRFLVKRISDAGPTRMEVVGDNEARSRDSRKFGPISLEEVVGKVWIRLRR